MKRLIDLDNVGSTEWDSSLTLSGLQALSGGAYWLTACRRARPGGFNSPRGLHKFVHDSLLLC